MSRHVLVGLGLSLGSLVLFASALLAADLYLHTRHADEALNIRGYRGPVLGAKAPGEVRLAVLGGSTAFGYKVRTELAFPAQLEAMLAQRLDRPVSVANLAYNNESATCFASTLQSYAYLEPDVVLLYSGYNDLSPGMYLRGPADCYRNRSVIFRLTGYYPILPLYLEEKYYQLRYGSVERGYEQDQDLDRLRGLVARLGSPSPGTHHVPPAGEELASAQLQRYVGLVKDVVASQMEVGRTVVFVTQPYLNEAHRQQQEHLLAALQGLDRSPRFRYVNLGRAVDLHDPSLSYDGMHLTADGNHRIAAALVEPIAELLATLPLRPSS